MERNLILTEYKNQKIVFVDLDGVLVDFDKGVYDITGKLPEEQDARNMWSRIHRTCGFFENLDWLEDGRKLWEHLLRLGIRPIILTGSTSAKSTKEKQSWCQQNLGASVRVICCKTKEKPLYCIEGSYLIDDRTKVQDAWEKQGGIFLHYTGDNMDFIIRQMEENSNENNTVA